MLGWSIRASACRSASNRASTARESMPILISLSATCRLTGCGLLGPVDGAHPPLAEDFEQRVPAGDDLARDGSAGAVGRRGRPRTWSPRRPIGVPRSPVPTGDAFPRRTPRVASWVSGEVGSDMPVASRFQEPAGPVVGGEQRLDPPAEGGVIPARAVQVGGPRGRVGPFEGFGEDGHQVRGRRRASVHLRL